jgi:Ca2+-binding RTX toxin-like protein
MAVITGNNNVNDRLEGGSGSDQISGLSGNDTLIGGAGRDTLFGGDGDDILDTAGLDWMVRSQDDVVDGGAGNDIVNLNYADLVWVSTEKPIRINFTFGQTFQIQIDGYVGATISNCENIQIQLADGNDNVTLGAGDDYIDGNLGNDTIVGGAGDDYVMDGDGKFSLDGGLGDDFLALEWGDRTADMTFDVNNGNAMEGGRLIGIAVGFEGVDIYTGDGNDRLTGGKLADRISASDGANVIVSAAGDDTLYTGSGADRIDAGEGRDHIEAGAGADRIDAGEGDDYVSGGEGADTIMGGGGNDVLVGNPSFLTADDVIYGGAGDDTVRLALDGALSGSAATVDGGAGRDTLIWSGGFKSGGMLDLSSGSASVPGGGSISGFEIFNIRGSQQADTIIAGRGADYLNGQGGDDDLRGGVSNDTLVGGAGADSLDGGDGNDTLHGFLDFYTVYSQETGDNRLLGGEGDDILFGMNGDFIEGGRGKDKLSFAYELDHPVVLDLKKAARPDAATHVLGVETVEGGNGADLLVAGKKGGIDIWGGYGADTLIGRGGDDVLFGSAGADSITTGRGADTIVFYSLWQDGDTVTDFDPAHDQIRLDAFNNALPTGVLASSRFLASDFTGTPAATVAGPQFLYDTSDGRLWLDWDGTGGTYQPLLQATFLDAPEITAADFFVR